MFDFLTADDRHRFDRTVEKLRAHDVSAWVLTGGLALEAQLARRGGPRVMRPLNDLDFIVAVFDEIPPGLGRDFLIRHVHPHDPPAKTLLQAIDEATALRADVFRAYGEVIARSDSGESGFRVVSLADLVARLGRLCWDVIDGKALPSKYAADFLRALAFVGEDEMEVAWRDHRKGFMAETFVEATQLLGDAIARRPDLLVTPNWYSTKPETCPRCFPVAGLALAEPARVLAVLGYC